MNPDLINGTFESLGAAFILMDVMRLRRDKMIRGVSWPTRLFFMSWGVFNLYYYSSLDQPLSWWGGVAMVAANIAWCYHAVKYRRN